MSKHCALWIMGTPQSPAGRWATSSCHGKKGGREATAEVTDLEHTQPGPSVGDDQQRAPRLTTVGHPHYDLLCLSHICQPDTLRATWISAATQTTGQDTQAGRLRVCAWTNCAERGLEPRLQPRLWPTNPFVLRIRGPNAAGRTLQEKGWEWAGGGRAHNAGSEF